MSGDSAAGFRIAAVLPALNEAGSIAAVVRAVAPYARPVVVDDGSSDGTGELARAAGAEVVTHAENRGYDAALQSGIYHSVSLGFDAVVTLDADGQHDPTLLLKFITALAEGSELVIGVRDRRQRWAESLFASIGSAFWGIEDALCGMKGYRTTLLRKAAYFDSYSSIGTQLALRAVRSGVPFVQVGVPTRARRGSSRFGVGLRPNLRILRALILGVVLARSL